MILTHAGDYSDANNRQIYGGAFMTPFSLAAGARAIVSAVNYSSLANVALPVITDTVGALTLRRLSHLVAIAADTPSLSLWIVEALAAWTGTLTFTFGPQQRGLLVSVDAITDGSRAEPVRLANRPTPTRGTGVGVTSTLAALAAATSIHFYAVSHFADEVTAHGTGFTELYDVHFADAGGSGTNHALEVGYKLNDTTADPSWATSSPYVIGSLELQAAAITEPVPHTPFMPAWLAAFTPRLATV